MKEIIVTWTATYTTTVKVPDNAEKEEIEDAAVAQIDVTTLGGNYKQDSFVIESLAPVQKVD